MATITEQPNFGAKFHYSRQAIVYRVAQSATLPVGATFYGIRARVFFAMGASFVFAQVGETYCLNTPAEFELSQIISDGFLRTTPIQTATDNLFPQLNIQYSTYNRHWEAWGRVYVQFEELYTINGLVSPVAVGLVTSDTINIVNGAAPRETLQPYANLPVLTTQPALTHIPKTGANSFIHFFNSSVANVVMQITVHAVGGAVIATYNKVEPLPIGVWSANVGTANLPALPSNAEYYVVQIAGTGFSFTTSFALTCGGACRLHWANEYGGVDSWTFPYELEKIASKSTAFSKYPPLPTPNTPANYLYSHRGRATLGVAATRQKELSSGELNALNNSFLKGVSYAIECYEELLIGPTSQYLPVTVADSEVIVGEYPSQTPKAPELAVTISYDNKNIQRW